MNIEITKPIGPRVLSYCAFKAKLNNRRPDINQPKVLNFDKYMRNLPAAIIANSEFYRGYQIRFAISSQLENQVIAFFQAIANGIQHICADMVKDDFVCFEPSMWRMWPVFDKSVHIVFCRDIDSVPNTKEVAASHAFDRSSYCIHSIRSHPAHSCSECRLLAGLCGFKPNQMPIHDSYDAYYQSKKNHEWGCDQRTLITYFIENRSKSFIAQNILDSPLHSFAHVNNCPNHYPGVLPTECYDFDFGGHNNDIREAVDAFTVWPGCNTVDSRGEILNRLLNSGTDVAIAMKNLILSDSYWSKYYQVI